MQLAMQLANVLAFHFILTRMLPASSTAPSLHPLSLLLDRFFSSKCTNMEPISKFYYHLKTIYLTGTSFIVHVKLDTGFE